MIHYSNPASASQTKDRLYAQLAMSISRLKKAVGRTADLCEQLKVELHAIRTFAGYDAATFMAIAAEIGGETVEEDV